MDTAVAEPAAAAAGRGVIPALPFTSSSHEHVEPAFTVTATPTTAEQQLNPIDIPAYGYFRYLFLEVVCSGGVGGTLAADAPWNILSRVTLQDVNGANIVDLSGYNLFLANLIGGYSFNADPSDSPWYVGSAPNPAFYLRVPVEISRKDGLGSLANQNSAANFKLNLSINTRANITSADFTTPPLVTIKGWLEAWTLPAQVDGRGRPQAQVPPLLGTGQYWSSQRVSGILVGNNTLPIRRVGNLIRTVIFVARDASNVRVDTVFPDPMQFTWDGNVIFNASQKYLQQYLFEEMVNAARPTGVYALLYNTGGPAGHVGNEEPNLYLPTAQSSRLELYGNSAVAGSIEVIMNEIAPIEQVQTERYMVPNDSSFRPAT